MAPHLGPVVCTLSSSRADDRLLEWTDIQRLATSIDPVADGVRVRFASKLLDYVADLAERESQCCSFLDIGITEREDGWVDLSITSRHSDGVRVARLLAGLTGE